MKQVVTGADSGRGGTKKTITSLIRFAALPALLILLVAGMLPGAGIAGTLPVYEGFELITPLDGKLKNGDPLEFYAFWDSTHYEISASFIYLDDTATTPVVGVYNEEKGAYWFASSVSDENSRADDGTVAIRMTADNPVNSGRTISSAMQVCLSNHPPSITRAEIIGDEERFVVRGANRYYQVRNGDIIHIETDWEYTLDDFHITADFSAVDDSVSNHTPFYWGVSEAGIANYEIHYELDGNAFEGSQTSLPIQINGFDGGCGVDSITVLVDMDNQGPTQAPSVHHLPDYLEEQFITIRGGAPTGTHDVMIVVNSDHEFVFDVSPSADTLIFEGEIEFDHGLNFLAAYARDLVGNRSPAYQDTIDIPVGGAPVFKNCFVVEPDTASVVPEDPLHLNSWSVKLKHGDFLRFYSYWDSYDIYSVSADLSNIDSNGPTQLMGEFISTVEVAYGDSLATWNCYAFEYQLSGPDENTVADAKKLIVPVTAYNLRTGAETTSKALKFCMCNSPLHHIRTWLVTEPALWTYHAEIGDTTWVMRNGAKFIAYSSWFTDDTSPRITVDFSGADRSWDQDLESSLVTKTKIDSLTTDTVRTYRIAYRFAEGAVGDTDPKIGLPVKITFTEGASGCGTETATLLLEMDVAGPANPPILTSSHAAKTTDSLLVITGTVASDASSVMIRAVYSPDSMKTTVFSAETDHTFSGATPPLLTGENKIYLFALDEIGNRSKHSSTFTVYRVEDGTIEIPKPFRAGDRFEVNSIVNWSQLDVAIFNLEGDKIRTWSYDGATATNGVSITWDGTNHSGDRVATGPYLLQIKAKDVTGNTQKEEVKAFVFTR